MSLQKNKSMKAIVSAVLLGLAASASADYGVSIGTYNGEYKKGAKANISIGPAYRGDKFNIDRGVFSYDFLDSNQIGLEAVLSSKNGGYKSGDHKTFKGMDKRKASVDAGARAIIDTGTFLGSAVVDVTKDFRLSHGISADMKLGGVSPHAPHWTGEKTFYVVPTAGVRYDSKKTVDYFYGVKASEATSNRKAYKGKSSFSPYIGVEGQANLSQHFTVNGSVRVMKRGNGIRNSPLTSNKKYQGVAELGLTYWF